MVVCTFLEAYDLKDKVIIPFFTYESMQKIYKVTPDSKHIPETLPEDLDADDITTPGRPDDAGIDMPGSANGTEGWLRRIGIMNRHIKQVKAEKNRNGRISDNGSNLFNALGCAFYVFMQVKHRIHTLTLAYVRLYQGAKSLLVELIIHFYALRRIILKQQK